jgi:aspartate racemase
VVLGILGGMGPRASAELVRRIYEASPVAPEQEAPRVLLASDPTLPDRTEALLAGDGDELRARLAARLRWLADGGATHLLVACVTAHAALDRLAPDLAERLVDLRDVLADALDEAPGGRWLVASSHGTARLRVVTGARALARHRARLVAPHEVAQQALHAAFYALKQPGGDAVASARRIAAIARAERCDGVVLACTEGVLVPADAWGDLRVVEPLGYVAENLGAYAGDARRAAL